jgi:hypothetical protein
MAEQQAPTWADPTPAGLFGVAAGTTAVWALLTGRIGMQDLHIFIAWLMGAALILAIVGLINFRRGDTVSGSLNLAFGILFFGVPAITYAFLLWGTPMEFLALLAGLGISTALPGVVINGWVFFVLGAILLAFVPIMARQTWVMSVALLVFGIAVWLLAAWTVQGFPPPPAWYYEGVVAGWLIGLAGLVMLYMGVAMILIHGVGRVVLPIGRPLIKPAAAAG